MRWALGLLIVLAGCTTRYVEFKGACVLQQWQFATVTMRARMLCDLPPPTALEGPLRERDAMETNPFPDLFDLKNDADSPATDLLEENMGVPQNDKERWQ